MEFTDGFLGDFFSFSSAICWSFAVILYRVAGFHLSPIPFTIFKNFIAILCYFIAILVMGLPLVPDLDNKDWVILALSGVLGITIADVFFQASLNRLGAGLQSIVDCVYAPSMIFLGYFLFRETISMTEIFGASLVATAIVLGISKATEVRSKKDLFIGIVLGSSAHVIMGIGILMSRDIFREISIVWVCGFRFLFANSILLLYGLLFHRGQSIWAGFRDPKLYLQAAAGALLGSFASTILWVAGLKFTEAGRAAIYNQMSSVIIPVLGIIILKEKITLQKVLGVLLGIAGGLIISLA